MPTAIVIAVIVIFVTGFIVIRAGRWRVGITPVSAYAAANSGKAIVIDVREPKERRGGVAEPAVLLSYSDFRGRRTQWKTFLEQNRNQRFLIYCGAGVRSGEAVVVLRREGYRAESLGSFRDWTKAGLPVRQL